MEKCSDPELAELPYKLGCGKAVRLTGFISQEEKEKLLSNSHCFILTSRHEGLGIVYLEGQEYGLPCIATDNGGAKSIVHHEINGLVSPVGDINTLQKTY